MTEENIKKIVLNNLSKYDTSGDGTLDQRELAEFFEDVLKRRPSDAAKYKPMDLAKNFIRMVDLNGD